MTGEEAKELAREVSQKHNAVGASLTPYSQDVEDVGSASDASEWVMEVEGPYVSPKDVRSLLWETRKWHGWEDGTGIVWSIYDEKAGVSRVGWGRLAPQPQETT
jgi:hypothetical protein